MGKLHRNGRIARLEQPVSDRDHLLGPLTAPVVLVEYADFECPRSHEAYFVVKDIVRFLGNNLCFVFRHFPNRQKHKFAFNAALSAEIADGQTLFWEMHDKLFERQNQLDDVHLTRYAAELNLDSVTFSREMFELTHARRIEEDCRGGAASGVTETPTFFINGIRFDGAHGIDTLLAAIEDAALQSERKGNFGNLKKQNDSSFFLFFSKTNIWN